MQLCTKAEFRGFRACLGLAGRHYGFALLALHLSIVVEVLPRDATAVAFEIVSSEAESCFTNSLCVEVAAHLSGDGVFGSHSFEIPLPAPDDADWIPVTGSIAYVGGFSVGGVYETSLVRSREQPPYGALMGIFGESLNFRDASGKLLAQPGTGQTIVCAPVPDGYTETSYPCSDANGGGGVHGFGPTELYWSREPLDLQVDFASTPPLPIAGSEYFHLGEQQIHVSVVYDAAPPPAAPWFEILSTETAECADNLLCVTVVGKLSGTAEMGILSFPFPMPVPDPSRWGPIAAEISPGLGAGVRASWLTDVVRERELNYYPNGALMGGFGEFTAFRASDGTTVGFGVADGPIGCSPIPAGYSAPTYSCVDGNVGFGFRTFGPGELAWTRQPLTFQVELAIFPPLPVPGTERFNLNEQYVQVLIEYSRDSDGDGIPQEADNCPLAANPGQEDHGGIGTSEPDGVGDACQCGDVNGNGRLTVADAALILRSLLTPPRAILNRPELCDVGGSAGCSTADAAIVLRALLQPATAEISQSCSPARP